MLDSRKDLFTGPLPIVLVAGISLGAVEASLTALTDARVGAAAIIAGGGGIAKILAQTAGAGVDGYVRARDAYMKAHSLSAEQLAQLLEAPSRRSEPLAYITAIPAEQRLSPERYLMINARGDMVVPNATSEVLYQALGHDGRHPDRCEHFYKYLAPNLERP